MAGTTDARLTFEIRNDSDTAAAAFTQYAGLRFYYNGPTVSLAGMRQLRVKLKSDRDRTVRIEIESAAYRPSTATVRPKFGWTVMATAAGATVTLDPAAATIQPWATANGDTLGTILGSTNRLTINAIPTGRGSNGLLPAGTSDKGWLQVDDLELVMN
jgi:hypothetical protein